MANMNGSVCLNHPNTPAVARCACCSKPVCAECAQVHDGVTYCSKLCYENAKRTGLMVDDVNKRKAASNAKRLIAKIIFLVILAAAAFFGYNWYKNNKGTVNQSLNKVKQVSNQAVNSVDKVANDAKKKVDANLIKDSKYKKDREDLVK